MGDIGSTLGAGIQGAVQENTNRANREIADQNLAFQREQYEYQKQLNQTQMQREDTAIQRQVADYQAVGFNKLLATQSGGSATTALTSAQAPQNNMRYQAAQIQLAGNMISEITDFVQTVQERKLQMEKTREETNLIKGQIDYQNTDIEINKINKLLKDIELEHEPYRQASLITEWLKNEAERQQRIKDYQYYNDRQLPYGGGVGYDNEINSLIKQLESGNLEQLEKLIPDITSQLKDIAGILGESAVQGIKEYGKELNHC